MLVAGSGICAISNTRVYTWAAAVVAGFVGEDGILREGVNVKVGTLLPVFYPIEIEHAAAIAGGEVRNNLPTSSSTTLLPVLASTL